MSMSAEKINVDELIGSLEEMEFRDLGTFNEGSVGAYWTNGGGTSPWEMHPNDDELLHILDGSCTIGIMTPEGLVETELSAGEVIIVPKGFWHRHSATGPYRELFVTPGATEHSHAENPLEEA